MAQQNNIAQQLNDLLVTRNFHPDMLDAQGKVCDSEDAKTFTFDYISGAGKNYGTMVVILDSDNDLKAFYGDNLGRSMEGDDKDEFFDFQQHLSQFANAHRWTYTAKDLGQLKHTMQGLAAIKEGLFEGYYGTRRISYAGEPTEARLMIRHNRNLGENDARFRYVESIFVETADGERYRLPFTNLAGGRAMLEHVRQGGKPYDVRGNHICEMITELKVLTRFNRASQGRVLEGIKQGVVEGAQTYYKSLRESIKRLSSPRGYAAYFESWHPADITAQDQLVEDIKTLFVEQTIDDRIEQALPLLAKIQRGREMKEADIFENWVNSVTESHWSLPETPEQLNRLKELMAKELIVGPDGTNAKEQLRDLIGDDDLFNRIEDLAAQDPRANLWDDTDVQDILRALGIQMPDRAAPDMAAEPQQTQGVAEAAKWRDPKYQGKTFDYDDSYEGPHDTRPGRVSLDRAGMRQIDTFDPLEYKARKKQATGKLTPKDVKYATAQNFGKEKQQQLDYDRSRKAEQGVAEGAGIGNPDAAKYQGDFGKNLRAFEIYTKTLGSGMEFYNWANTPKGLEMLAQKAGTSPESVKYSLEGLDWGQWPEQEYDDDEESMAEADNISTFESLQRMRHLSGMPLKESRIEESSEFMYEKIGKTLAQQQPMLDVKSDQFVHAVYGEMIELGMTPKSAEHKLSYDQDFLDDVSNSFHHYVRHGTNDMLDEAGDEFPPLSDPSKYPEVAATQPLPADAFSTGQLTIRPTPTTSPAGPVVGASTNPAVQQAVKDASGGQFVAKTAPPPAAAPAAEYTGPTAGGAPTNLPAGINRLTGKPNAPAAPAPAPAAPAPAASAPNSLQNNVLPSGATTRSLAKPAPVEEDQYQSEFLRRRGPGGFPMKNFNNSLPNTKVTSLDLSNQQTEPDPLDAMKKAAGLPTPRTVKPVDLVKNPELAIGVGEPQWDYKDSQPEKPAAVAAASSQDNPFSKLSSPSQADIIRQQTQAQQTQAQKDRMLRMFAQDEMMQDQRDRIERMRQGMSDTTSDETTEPDVSYTADGIPRIRISASPEESAPLEECNYTPLNEYCPCHGLKECWLEEMNQSILATGSRLIEDLDEGGMPGMGAALRGAGEMGGKAANAVKSLFKAEPEVSALRGPPPPRAIKYPEEHPDFPVLQTARDREQGNMKVWNKRYPEIPWAPQSDADLLKSFNHDQNVEKGFGQFQRDAMPNDYSPTGYTRAQKSKGAAIDAQNSMQGNQDLFKNAYGIDEADMMNPEIPSDFGSPEHLAHLAGLGKALQAGDRSALGKSNAALAAAQVGQGKTPWEPAPTPSFGTPGAAHAGQSGYNYQDEEPKGQAHSGQGGYTYYDYDDADQSSAETARLGRLRNPNVDPALAHMLINPNNPDAFAMQRDEEPDQSDAETARLGRAGASADSDFVHAPGEAGRSINYESREGDAMLARIKSLALIR